MAVPTFTTHRSTGWVPSSSPAASPRLPRSTSSWPSARPTLDPTEVTAAIHAVAVCTADRPRSVRFEPTFHFRGFHHWFLHSCTSPSHLTDPGRLTVPTRPAVVGAAPTLTRISGFGLPPASSGCCDSPTRKVSHLPAVQWRLVAHRVVRPHSGARSAFGNAVKASMSARAVSRCAATVGSFSAEGVQRRGRTGRAPPRRRAGHRRCAARLLPSPRRSSVSTDMRFAA